MTRFGIGFAKSERSRKDEGDEDRNIIFGSQRLQERSHSETGQRDEPTYNVVN